MAAPILRYYFQSIHTGRDMVPFGEGTPTLGATYGDYTGLAPDTNANRKATCRVTISYSNVNWVLNPDNSVTVSGRINTALLQRTATGVPSNGHQDIWCWFGDPEVEVTHLYVGSGTSGTYNLVPEQYRNFSFTIPASTNPQEYVFGALHYKNRFSERPQWMDERTPPDEFRVGLFITNPNPPTYRPGKILDNGNVWQSHNRTGGASNILLPSQSWQTMETSNGAVLRNDPPYIRDVSDFIDMRKIGENA